MRLRDVIAHCLTRRDQGGKYRQEGYVYERVLGDSVADALDRANRMAVRILDRVKVMRVFDFAGVVEAIGEVGEMWEKLVEDHVALVDKPTAVFDPDKEIPNSQDSNDSEEHDQNRDVSGKPLNPPTAGIGMIIIDNIANPISSIMAKSQVQGTRPPLNPFNSTPEPKQSLTQFPHQQPKLS